MKRMLCWILAVMMLVSMTACELSDIPQKEPGDTQTQTQPQKKDETFKLNETAAFRTLKFTATELKEAYGETYFAPEEGNVFVGVKFTIENISEEDQTVSSILLFEAYVDDVKCSESFSAAMAFNSEMLDGTIAPGKKLVGWYTLEVPENWKTLELHVQANWLSNSNAKFVFSK